MAEQSDANRETRARIEIAIGSIWPLIRDDITEDAWRRDVVPQLAREVTRIFVREISERHGLQTPHPADQPWSGERPFWLGLPKE